MRKCGFLFFLQLDWKKIESRYDWDTEGGQKENKYGSNNLQDPLRFLKLLNSSWCFKCPEHRVSVIYSFILIVDIHANYRLTIWHPYTKGMISLYCTRDPYLGYINEMKPRHRREAGEAGGAVVGNSFSEKRAGGQAASSSMQTEALLVGRDARLTWTKSTFCTPQSCRG